jgi:hypothetical protein
MPNEDTKPTPVTTTRLFTQPPYDGSRDRRQQDAAGARRLYFFLEWASM